MSILDALITALALVAAFFFIVLYGQWFTSIERDKRKKQSRQQKSVNELLDAFEIYNIAPGKTVHLTTKGDLVSGPAKRIHPELFSDKRGAAQ